VKRTTSTLSTALLLCLAAPTGLAQALSLEMPAAAVTSAGQTSDLTSYAVPTGPFRAGTLPSRRVEGPMRQTVWRVDAPGASTLELLAPLRAQLVEAGFRPLFECETAACGGFDFRYGTLILPEPDMHVDLGDFRFFAAERGAEVVSLVVSRSSVAGFVQMIHVGGAANAAPPALVASTKAPPVPGQPVALMPPQTAATLAGADTLADRLTSGGSVPLEDLVFASGSAALADGQYPSLIDLAGWLIDNPGLTVALVGHTDASGGLDGNIALSRKRAEAVRQHLIEVHGIPPTQVEAQGVGYLSPRASNLTEDGRKQNRRVEVMVTSTQFTP
jgi:OOP family OmpA-OmpF porin